MKRKRYSDEQTAFALRQAVAWTARSELEANTRIMSTVCGANPLNLFKLAIAKDDAGHAGFDPAWLPVSAV